MTRTGADDAAAAVPPLAALASRRRVVPGRGVAAAPAATDAAATLYCSNSFASPAPFLPPKPSLLRKTHGAAGAAVLLLSRCC